MGNKMDLIYSRYTNLKPKRRTIFINADLIAVILSIISYSFVVIGFYGAGYSIGVIVSCLLMSIMFKRGAITLMGLYAFFLMANFYGLLHNITFLK
jgi:hypothetical protein